MTSPAAALRESAERSRDVGGAGWPWAFTRCWLLTNGFDGHGRDRRDLDAALAEFARIPDGAPGRARLAAVLVNLHVRVGGLRTPEEIDPIHDLAAIADGDPAPFPQWPADRAVVRALWLMISLQHGRAGVDPRTALGEIDELATVVGRQQPHARMIETARLLAQHLRAAQDGDLRAMEDLPRQFGRLAGGAEPSSPIGIQVRIMSAMQEVHAVVARGDLLAAAVAVDALAALRRELPPQSPTGQQVDRAVATFRAMVGPVPDGDTGPLGPPTDTTPDQIETLRRMAELPGLSTTERALRMSQLGTLELAAGGDHLDDGVRHLRAAVDTAPAEDARRGTYLMTLGVALGDRYEQRSDRRDLTECVAVLQRARDLAGGPEHPDWSTIGMSLGHTQRLSGRRALGNIVGRDGLRGHAWSVLLQAGTADATAAARHAATDAVDVARWFLHDQDPGGAALALDTGRGLILRSAVRFGDVAKQLETQGERDLAQRWREAVGGGAPELAPPGLRRDVIAGLGVTLDPPELAELRAAMARMDMDALVYLVLGDAGVGAAVVVPAHEEPSWLPLPLLATSGAARLDAWLARDVGLGVRDADAAGAPASDTTPWRLALDDVCRWAWDAAVGPLLDAHLPARHGLGPGRVPRLVLVPMGPLARVPWHAADTGHGRALQRAVFSYAVSARTFCDSAWAAEVPREPGLVIGDPDTGGAATPLWGARVEALAVHDAFYRDGRYVGRTADGRTAGDGPGSGDDVVAWLADGGAGTVLHAACHGTVEVGTGSADTSYLLLAGGSRFAAEDLIRTVARRRTRGIALAVLAACSSGVPGRGYDEAFSIATAFLTAGARTVVSALWQVPDTTGTSVLMFLFHHFLRTRRPIDALRDAQLWMLDPGHVVPDEMPASLRAGLDEPADVAAWAGFTHTGR